MARTLMPWPIPREWGPSTAEAIQLNFERLFKDASPDSDTETIYTPPVIAPYTPPTLNAEATRYEMYATGTTVTMVATINNGTIAGGSGPARATPPFADGPYLQNGLNVATGSYSIQGPATSASAMQDLIWDFDASFIIRTDANGADAGLYSVGICRNIAGTSAAPLPNEAGCYFQGSASAGWYAYCHDGTTLSPVSVQITSLVASTRYLLRIRKVANQAFFSVNGGPETVIGSNVPVTSRTGACMNLRLLNLSGTARLLYFSRAWCVYGQ